MGFAKGQRKKICVFHILAPLAYEIVAPLLLYVYNYRREGGGGAIRYATTEGSIMGLTIRLLNYLVIKKNEKIELHVASYYDYNYRIITAVILMARNSLQICGAISTLSKFFLPPLATCFNYLFSLHLENITRSVLENNFFSVKTKIQTCYKTRKRMNKNSRAKFFMPVFRRYIIDQLRKANFKENNFLPS